MKRPLGLLILGMCWAGTCLSLEDCSCVDVSKVWEGVSFHCQLCRTVPQSLPEDLTFLGLDHFLGSHVTEDDFHRYKKTLTQVRLYMEENTPSNIGIHSFQNLAHLTRLFLSENGMEHFPHLPHSIEIAELQKNKLKSVPDMYLPNLVEMMLDHNQIKEVPGLLVAPKLAVFSLYGNQLKTANLRPIPSLRLLDLGMNQLDTFPQLPDNITIVKLTQNNIQSVPKLKLRRLKQLDLSDNRITHIEEGTFDGCPDLEMVYLANNPIEHIHPSQQKWVNQFTEDPELPGGLRYERQPRRNWMMIGVITMFVMCGFILILLVFLIVYKRGKTRRYEQLKAKGIWHTNMRTPIYKPKLNKQHINKPYMGQVYKPLVEEIY